MGHRETYSVTATLTPDSGTAALLRIVSIFHSRGVKLHNLTFATDRESAPTVAACLVPGNTRAVVLEESLRRVVDVVKVSTHAELSPELS